MHKLAVDADAQQLRVTRLELAVELAEGCDFRRAHEREVLGPEEHDLPLALEAVVAEGLEGAVQIAGDHTLELEAGKLLSDA